MMRLKAALIREYEENEETLNIHSPANNETVDLHFRGEKMAKVTSTAYSVRGSSSEHTYTYI